jgi:hypothetical protein
MLIPGIVLIDREFVLYTDDLNRLDEKRNK